MSSRASLTELRSLLDEVAFPLDLAGTVDGSTVRRELIGQLDDYVLPRLARLDAPLLAVFGGSTGAGKSTLVNSLVGHTVTAPGVLRPTTRRPVLVCHADDTAWFVDGEILGDLPRYHRAPSADPASGSRSDQASGSTSGHWPRPTATSMASWRSSSRKSITLRERVRIRRASSSSRAP